MDGQLKELREKEQRASKASKDNELRASQQEQQIGALRQDNTKLERRIKALEDELETKAKALDELKDDFK